jgi:hypothetical protein
MDLLSVLEHELGHAAGFEHSATGVMEDALTAGTRTVLAPDLDAVAPTAAATSTAPTAPTPPTPPAGEELDFSALLPHVAASAPAIAWSVDYDGVLLPPTPAAGWQQDFVSHLARSEAQRNPNAGLRVQVELAPKLAATSRGIEPLV